MDVHVCIPHIPDQIQSDCSYCTVETNTMPVWGWACVFSASFSLWRQKSPGTSCSVCHFPPVSLLMCPDAADWLNPVMSTNQTFSFHLCLWGNSGLTLLIYVKKSLSCCWGCCSEQPQTPQRMNVITLIYTGFRGERVESVLVAYQLFAPFYPPDVPGS